MPIRLVSQEELPSPLSGYKLIERLGRGGFGEVWKVEAPGGLHKAAKFVFGDLEAMNEDSRPAEQELKALKRVRDIRHPYILSLERYDQIDGQLIIMMELADRNLWDRFRECRGLGMVGIPREELLRYLEEAAEALDLMNTHYQIQHLDIKPQNLFLVHNHIKVGDFGLAKLLEGVRATVTGGVTPVYAAPETFEGWISRFSDQYSLAIVFQELLTGNRPFNGANTRQLLMQHLNGTPDLSSLPPADQPTIARGLHKTPDERWPSCSDMLRALRDPGATTATAAPTSAAFQRASRSSPTAPVAQTPAPPRSDPGAGPATHLAGRPPQGDPSMAEPPSSSLLTRMAGSGQVPPNPSAPTKVELPQPPIGLPPLKPAARAPNGPPPSPLGLGAKLVTPSSGGGANPSYTLQRPVIFQTGRMGSLGIAPPEKTGDGCLFPALVVGVGQLGRRVLEQFRSQLCDRYAHPDKVPNIRFLFLDTDPDGMPQGVPDHPSDLTARESVLARLNRPSHYLQRDSLPSVDAWMPSGTLYKLARNPGAAEGIRSLGRLALFDNYRLIAQRLRQEIETFLNENALNEAAKNTGLTLRTNRPRAYIVTSFTGGTGGGMFLDLAFLLRHELRQVGFLKPDVVGLFFAPSVDRSTAKSAPLGNAYAAMAELYHYQSKVARYQTTFDKSEAPVVDTEAPFSRFSILQLPKFNDPHGPTAAVGLAARSLFHDLFTPIGRVTDEIRAAQSKSVPIRVPVCQTFGMFRLSWPRPEMLTAATRRFAQRQLQRWTAKEANHLREPITNWLAQQWVERRFDLETMADDFRAVVKETLREEPQKVFDALIYPLGTRTPSSGKIDAAGAASVFDQLLKVVGKPDCEGDATPALLHAALTARYEQVMRESEAHIAMMAATFLEVPQFRLPAAEEAVRQITAKLKQQVEALEPIRNELDKEVRQIYGRLFHAIGALSSTGGLATMVGRKASLTAEVFDLLNEYPGKRLKLHVADMCLSVYRRSLANAPEYLREINFCRGTLGEMQASLANTNSGRVVCGKFILPPGCEDLNAAADLFLAGLTPETLLTFEQALQKEIARKLKGVGSVCLHPKEKGPRFCEILLARSREFLDKQLDQTDPATMFFRYHTDDGSAEPLLGEAFEEATPDLTTTKGGDLPYEMNVLGAPSGKAGEELRALASRVLPSVDLIAAPLPEDICFYREYPQLLLADLPQLGANALEAYQIMASCDHPPHSRTDIPWQFPGT